MLTMGFGLALTLLVLTGLLWGSWYVVIKVVSQEDMPVFTFWLYIFANVIVWLVVLLGRKTFIPEGIAAELRQSGSLLPMILFLGALFGINIQLTLYLMGRLGIIFTISISSTFGILGGTLISALLGGLPAHVNLVSLMLVALVLLCATLCCQISGYYRDRGRRAGQSVKPCGRDYALFALNVLMGLSFTIATNVCCRSTTNPGGMAPMLFCGFLGLGALLGTLVVSTIRLRKGRRWMKLLRPGKKLAGYAAIAAICHYGGDVIYMLAAPSVSMSIAWPLSTTSNLWSYLWGVLVGEYRSCGRSAKVLLASGVILFVLGVVLMSFVLYR